MTDTDKISAAFENYAKWAALPIDLDPYGDYKSEFTRIAWNSYKQGQRDLIASLGGAVAYQVISHNGWDDRLYPTKDAPKGFAEFLETERSVGNTVRALHFVPEVGE